MRIKFAVLLQCVLLFCTQSVRAVNFEMVTVGNPGNAPDMRYNLITRPEGCGAVNYVYQIGKYEITAGQYAEFLNAVAKSDPNGLYWFRSIDSHIWRVGDSPNYTYSVAPDWANRPMVNVSFWNAARFCNWLHNGQHSGPQGPGTTEDGAYHDIGNPSLFGRTSAARFFLPTDDEWYKAAYHNNAAGLLADYFLYPTRSNIPPGTDSAEITNAGNNANYSPASSSLFAPYYRTNVGEFELSVSPYGTFDQGGNVSELVELLPRYLVPALRGGSYQGSLFTLSARYLDSPGSPNYPWDNVGFRIAAAAPVPEPTGLLLFSVAAVVLGSTRLRTRRGQASWGAMRPRFSLRVILVVVAVVAGALYFACVRPTMVAQRFVAAEMRDFG